MNYMIGAKGHRIVRGFTIVELLVVLTIFSFSAVAISATYINFTRIHRQVANAETLNTELRYVSELIVRAVRNNRVDYSTNPIPSPQSHLSLLNSSNLQIAFSRRDASDAACTGLNVMDGCLAMFIEGRTATWTPFSGKNVDILQFRVYVTPTADPFTPLGYGVYANNMQPVVTVFMQARYNAVNPRERATISMQTSSASRIYVR